MRLGEPRKLVENSGFLSREALTLPDIAIPPGEAYFSILDAMLTSSPTTSFP